MLDPKWRSTAKRLFTRLGIPGWALVVHNCVSLFHDVRDTYALVHGSGGRVLVFLSNWGWALGIIWLSVLVIWPRRHSPGQILKDDLGDVMFEDFPAANVANFKATNTANPPRSLSGLHLQLTSLQKWDAVKKQFGRFSKPSNLPLTMQGSSGDILPGESATFQFLYSVNPGSIELGGIYNGEEKKIVIPGAGTWLATFQFFWTGSPPRSIRRCFSWDRRSTPVIVPHPGNLTKKRVLIAVVASSIALLIITAGLTSTKGRQANVASPEEPELKTRLLRLSSDLMEFVAERERAHAAMRSQRVPVSVSISPLEKEKYKAALEAAWKKERSEDEQMHAHDKAEYARRFAVPVAALVDQTQQKGIDVDSRLLTFMRADPVALFMMRDIATELGRLADRVK